MDAEREMALVVGGRTITGWNELQVESSMLQPADGFSFSAANLDAELRRLVAPGTSVQVRYGDETLMTGIIDDRDGSVDKRSGAVIHVAGRDLLGHLQDCSAPLVDLRKVTAKDLVAQLAAPWCTRIGTTAIADAAAIIPRAKTEPGETRYDMAMRYLSRANLMLWLTPDGQLMIGGPDDGGVAKYRLVVSREAPMIGVERVQVKETLLEQFNAITLVGQSAGDLDTKGESTTRPTVRATNDGVAPDRTMFLVDSSSGSLAQRQALVDREMGRRRLGELVYSCTVAYWEQDGVVWQPDCLVDVVDELHDIAETLYLARVQWQLSRSAGRTTALELRRKGLLLP